MRRTIPIEASLRRSRGNRRRGEPSVMPHRSSRGIVLRRDELDVVELQAEIVDGFLNQIGIFIAGVAELHRGHTDE